MNVTERHVNSPDREAGRLRSALETLGLVIAPVTLLTSLLFYFGWARSNSTFLYFGLDPSVVGLSLQDYLLRSIGALFLPLGTLLLTALVNGLTVLAVSQFYQQLAIGIIVVLAALLMRYQR